jgi:predicted O-linked N-acetylglucosamine transferase (SPINDLY family)
MPPQALEAVLRQDRLDILVDLAGHTELNRLVLFARRLAPVQATYLGYPDTTGLRSMDYRLVDEITDPAGRADPFCTEQLVRFAPTAWCYAPPQAPEPSPRPSTLGRPVTFGCFNNFAKVTDESLRAWGQILAAIPGSRLLLKGHGLGAPVLQAEVRRRLEAARIDARRVELLERIESQAEHLAAYARMDVALDTFPYHGTTTTCEALWMGVPVVTLAGDRHASRVGVSLLSAIGRPAWVARDWRDYARIAVELVGTPGQLAAESPILRDAMLRSPLMDRAGQATRFGAALRSMWRNRCAGPVPAEACAV